MGSGVKKLGRGANEVEFQVLRNGIDFKDGLGFVILLEIDLRIRHIGVGAWKISDLGIIKDFWSARFRRKKIKYWGIVIFNFVLIEMNKSVILGLMPVDFPMLFFYIQF